jgi:dehydrogenase/reductase SDR family protein 4
MVNSSEGKLQDKVAIITGASRGIGRDIALVFAHNGARIVVASRNKYGDLDKVVKEIQTIGAPVLAISAHGGKSEDLTNLVKKTLEQFKTIDILVNNAATNPVMAPITEVEERTWDQIMNVNLKGPFLLSQKVAREMVKKGSGCIINVASIDGIKPMSGIVPYSISKAGLIMLTQGMAKELGPYGIRVNAIAPGLIRTRSSEALWSNDKLYGERLSITPLGRIGESDEIANVALFLASDAASYISGATVTVDGGRLTS